MKYEKPVVVMTNSAIGSVLGTKPSAPVQDSPEPQASTGAYEADE